MSDSKQRIEERIAALRRINLSLPSESERDAAFTHLFARAEASVAAGRVAEEMQGARAAHARAGSRRDYDDHKRHILLAKLLLDAGK